MATHFDKKRTFMTQIGTCGTSVGQFVLAPFSSILIAYYGPQSMNLIFAGMFLNIFISGVIFKSKDLKKNEEPKEQIKFDKVIMKFPEFWVYLISQMLLNAGLVTRFPYFA
jgi:hypothetical protein